MKNPGHQIIYTQNIAIFFQSKGKIHIFSILFFNRFLYNELSIHEQMLAGET
jgi:hypothetical protein